MTEHTAPAGIATWLVAQREILAKLRSKAFLFSTGFLLAAVLVLQEEEEPRIKATDASQNRPASEEIAGGHDIRVSQ